jgi:hypothetical protein
MPGKRRARIGVRPMGDRPRDGRPLVVALKQMWLCHFA